MKVLVVSDTHKKNHTFYAAVEREKPDLVIHCGDAEGYESDFEAELKCPIEVVQGNNDFFSVLPREKMLEIGSYKVWVVHGHNYYVSMGNETIKQEAIDRGADIVLYGHTHRPSIDDAGNVIAINPGSISYPRQEGRQSSYVVIELDAQDEISYEIRFL